MADNNSNIRIITEGRLGSRAGFEAAETRHGFIKEAN